MFGKKKKIETGSIRMHEGRLQVYKFGLTLFGGRETWVDVKIDGIPLLNAVKQYLCGQDGHDFRMVEETESGYDEDDNPLRAFKFECKRCKRSKLVPEADLTAAQLSAWDKFKAVVE